jgi:hypothetical protein
VDDPEKRHQIARTFGQVTPFEFEHGYYFDPISPTLPTLPDGWKDRLIELRLASGVRAKSALSEDLDWLRKSRGGRRR